MDFSFLLFLRGNFKGQSIDETMRLNKLFLYVYVYSLNGLFMYTRVYTRNIYSGFVIFFFSQNIKIEITSGYQNGNGKIGREFFAATKFSIPGCIPSSLARAYAVED